MRRAIAVVCLLISFACNGEKKRLSGRLAVLEDQRASAMRRLDNDRTELHDAEDRLATLRTELAAQNTEVQAFLLNHKIAAACIRTSRVSWGSDAAPADEAAAGSRFGTAVCGVALLNGQFAREVAFVGEKLRETETRGKELKRQITALERTVESRRADLHAHESAVDELSAEVAAVRRQLSPD